MKWKGLVLVLGLVILGCDQLPGWTDKPEVVKTEVVSGVTVSEYVQPCLTTQIEQRGERSVAVPTNERGFQHAKREGAMTYPISHCLPCTQAGSPEEGFACYGDKRGKE